MKRIKIERERYFDSVFLMLISKEVESLPGVSSATAALATPHNVENLIRIGFASPELSTAGPNDLVVAIDAEDESAVAAAQERVEEMLTKKKDTATTADARPLTLGGAVDALPEANLAVISLPGDYAAREARAALRRGLHVMLFSDNVPLSQEIALKEEAIERGLLMMGPDCGTAIINGAPLCFANVVRRGAIGIVGASGTGIQEISSLIDRYGAGVSQAIGTGGRDLSQDVGGMMTLFGIDALAQDPQTEVIVVVSKAPAETVAQEILARLDNVEKPVVVQFIGTDARPKRGNVSFAGSLAGAARLACSQIGHAVTDAADAAETDRIAADEVAGMAAKQKRLVGMFCGGTLCQEAWHLLTNGGERVRSNVALTPELKLKQETWNDGHLLWDLGDDIFTQGRPHPMIEPSLRDDRIRELEADDSIAVIVLDLVLGHGAHADPAAGLAKSVAAAKRAFAERGGFLSVVSSITGTNNDPQGYSRQRTALEEAGVRVTNDNEGAARLALAVLAKLEQGGR